ncbi:methyltransferase domain-containing protein [Proteiniclasticum sp. C24MP]|uniref:class I SAM-dependent methyltransferase n=1 Tax=Proteiniclasticum sp. C24MP TaxID=3374101 RepID=UPI003754D0D9
MEKIRNANKDLKHLEERMTEYWGHRSESYSSQNMSQLFGEKKEVWENKIFSQIEEKKQMKILDIGTGPGFFAILCALRGHEVTAVDMSKDMIEKAKKNAHLAGAEIRFMEVGSRLPFDEASFDLIISRDVTWTLTEPEKQLKHWAMKLKPGGTMLYFDAEWYYYLRDENTKKQWEDRKEEIRRNGGYIYEKAVHLEAMAEKLPLTYVRRPLWDNAYWKGQDAFSCEILENLNGEIYSDIEQLQYDTFPEFLVSVRRG